MIELPKAIFRDDTEHGKEYVLLSDALTYGDQRAAEARADALQAMESVPADLNEAQDDSKVICPACCHQFGAVPVAVQAQLRALERVPMTSEQHTAICEAHECVASDGYFEARPQIDTNDRRKVFEAGFKRGFHAYALMIMAVKEKTLPTPPESKG